MQASFEDFGARIGDFGGRTFDDTQLCRLFTENTQSPCKNGIVEFGIRSSKSIESAQSA